MMPLNDGDATFTGSFTKLGWDEAGNQHEAGFKPPKGEKFVIMLLGTAPKDATDYDLEAALARLGFVPGDTAVQNWDFFQAVTNYMAAHDLLQIDHEDGGGHEAALNVVAGIERLRTMLEKLLPYAEAAVDRLQFEATGSEEDLELVRQAKELLS